MSSSLGLVVSGSQGTIFNHQFENELFCYDKVNMDGVHSDVRSSDVLRNLIG